MQQVFQNAPFHEGKVEEIFHKFWPNMRYVFCIIWTLVKQKKIDKILIVCGKIRK